MAGPFDGPPVVGLPEPVDRRLRLGPFPSGRDALKFLCYAAAGALLVPVITAPGALLVGAAGFLAATWRPEGRAWVERAVALVRWRLRQGAPRGGPMTGARGRPRTGAGYLGLGPAGSVAVLRTGGIPVAYLPPAELARRFEMFRDLLRGLDSPITFLITDAAIHAQPFRPRSAPAGADAQAQQGYSELVALLLKRRRGRRVYLAVGPLDDRKATAVARFEAGLAAIVERLRGLGLSPLRLRDRGLLEAARRFGWTVDEASA